MAYVTDGSELPREFDHHHIEICGQSARVTAGVELTVARPNWPDARVTEADPRDAHGEQRIECAHAGDCKTGEG